MSIICSSQRNEDEFRHTSAPRRAKNWRRARPTFTSSTACAHTPTAPQRRKHDAGVQGPHLQRRRPQLLLLAGARPALLQVTSPHTRRTACNALSVGRGAGTPDSARPCAPAVLRQPLHADRPHRRSALRGRRQRGPCRSLLDCTIMRRRCSTSQRCSCLTRHPPRLAFCSHRLTLRRVRAGHHQQERNRL